MKYTIYSDGASRSNPGLSGCGFIIYDESGSVVNKNAFPLGISTNNIAEYSAVIAAAKAVILIAGTNDTLDFKLDSELIVKQVNGQYKVKDEKLKPLFLDLLSTLKNRIFTFTHVRREANKEADKLSNIGCDMNSSNPVSTLD